MIPKKISFIFPLVLLCGGLLTGCCLRRVEPVIVPEAVFRTEDSVADRIGLPLSPQDRERIASFLAANGIRSGGASSDLEAAREAEGILTFLSGAALETEALLSGQYQVVKDYLGNKHTRQVVDARNHDPRHYLDANGETVFAPFPIAFKRKGIEWIFYPGKDGRIRSLLVAQDILKPKPKG